MNVQKPDKKTHVPIENHAIKLKVNGAWHTFYIGHDIEEADTLAYLLRERMGLSGLKVACDDGACGACTVILNGEAVLSCMTLAIEADGQDILTIEGLHKDDKVIAAFAGQSEPGYGTAVQCGYCTPGFVMTVKAFLNENPAPTSQEIKDALSGNICRCGCYAAIEKAVGHAAEKIAGQESKP